MPALHPRELWEESGRWTIMGQNLFKLQDRKGAWLVLGMTEEEVMTDIARKELRSYKQLPQIWYQIQTKFRDEPRPRAGLLRVRQFIMKDSYSFDLDDAGLDVSYKKHDAAYRAILTRSGLNFVAVQADSGAMGGSQSQEFMVYAEAGEDLIASCPACNYAANIDKATSRLAAGRRLARRRLLRNWCTPRDSAPLKHVGAFLQMEPAHQIKTMAYMALTSAAKAGAPEVASPVVVFLRGDHTSTRPSLPDCFRRPGTPAHGAGGDCEVRFTHPLVIWARSAWIFCSAGEQPEPGKVTVILDSALDGRRIWSPAPTGRNTICAM